MRSGVDRQTGQVLTGWAHCLQSIGVILTTAIGALIMARDFGMDGQIQDAPMTAFPTYISAAAAALRLNEPGFKLTRIAPTRAGADGVFAFDVAGDFYPNALDGDFSVVETGKTATIALPFMSTTVTP